PAYITNLLQPSTTFSYHDTFSSSSGPSPCEEERRAAMESSGAFVPSCDADGSFRPKQCQPGGRCWCVDPAGRELPGTRRPGDALVCGERL
uniref:Thyroglobulin type-1 domain-containing protein n=1 Tax=Fundulus heteroclitus TaxID=8078 RepID=A0A3Q2SU41_FUNHE